MGRLYDKLAEYGESDYYPYHMPGHKRNMKGCPLAEYYKTDITEIDGFDNLHRPEGILLDLEKRISRIYGAEETFLLINGSTAGILSAVSCVAEPGGTILVARNCHKSVYHGIYLKNYRVRYLYPKISERFGIAMGIDPQEILQALESEKGIAAVVVTSPTYEGIVSDIEKIGQIVHAFHIPLIVDEAHGAHFSFYKGFPSGAVKAGADIVVHSLHKTLPAPTQTGVLHVSGTLIDRSRLKRYLSIYQSSSPSYPLMAGIELCFDMMEKDGGRLFNRMYENWEDMLGKLEKCNHLRIWKRQNVLAEGMKDFDVGKLVISTRETEWTGKRLYEALLKEYHLQPEMAGEDHVLAMFTVMDTEEGYGRITEALLELDGQMSMKQPGTGSGVWETDVRPETSCRIAEAIDAKTEWVGLSDSAGRIAADFVNLYPPGIPVVVPGEIYHEKMIFHIERWKRENLTVQGINEKMQVLVKCEE